MVVPTVRIRLVTSNGERTFELVRGGTLLRAALRAGLPVARSCRGIAVCAACKVRVLDGGEHLRPPGPAEAALLAREPLRADERYACQARADGPCTLTTTYW
jgi:ferredoxin